MWEMNNHSWFSAWNENALSASAYKAEWITIVNGFRSVAGGNFKFDYNLTACQGSNGAGRTNFDSFPGTQYVDYIGIDVYDNNGSVAASKACIDADAAQAASYGLPMTIPEWGMYATDDPAFVNMIAAESNQSTFFEESLFSASWYAKGSSGWDITKAPNSLAAYRADFGGSGPPPTTTTTTTAPTTTTTTTQPTTTTTTTSPTTTTTTSPTTTTTTTVPTVHVTCSGSYPVGSKGYNLTCANS
jgi:hypothetical protein